MRLTKRQLKRIIKEEKKKILENFDDDQYGYGPPVENTGNASVNELEQAIFAVKDELMGGNIGYNEEEANETILRHVEEILSLR